MHATKTLDLLIQNSVEWRKILEKPLSPSGGTEVFIFQTLFVIRVHCIHSSDAW